MILILRYSSLTEPAPPAASLEVFTNSGLENSRYAKFRRNSVFCEPLQKAERDDFLNLKNNCTEPERDDFLNLNNNCTELLWNVQ